MNTSALIGELIEPTVQALGLELWGVEHIAQGKYSLLRIYIDRAEEGVKIEDCEAVSHQVSGLLDVEDPIKGEYTLEVSSPGMDRPLFTPAQFQRFTGSEISLRLHKPVDGRRKYKGVIVKVDGNIISLRLDEDEQLIDHSNIEKANIVY